MRHPVGSNGPPSNIPAAHDRSQVPSATFGVRQPGVVSQQASRPEGLANARSPHSLPNKGKRLAPPPIAIPPAVANGTPLASRVHMPMHDAMWRTGEQVVVVCAAPALLARTCAALGERGAVPRPLPDLTDFLAANEPCGVVVFFADGFAAARMVTRLRALERWRSGPTILVVTDRAPLPWKPKLKRDRPALVMSSAQWRDEIIRGTTNDSETGPSGPELPFTD